MEILITGLLLGGTYALVALGLNIQYGVSRIMNLANGEMLVAGAFAAFAMQTSLGVNPILTIFLVAPAAYILNWFFYRVMLQPLVKRAKTRGILEQDSILTTFGLAFVMVGLMIWAFGGDYFNYSFLSRPIEILGSNYGLNRVVAFGCAVVICAAVYFWLNHSRTGMSFRAVAVDPKSARLVGIDVPRLSAHAFALGGAITAVGGVVISTFLTLDASAGVVFTMKALIIVIMGGVGDVRGTIVAALILGVGETMIASLVDPGLTLAAAYGLFVLILLFRPQGLFGRRLA